MIFTHKKTREFLFKLKFSCINAFFIYNYLIDEKFRNPKRRSTFTSSQSRIHPFRFLTRSKKQRSLSEELMSKYLFFRAEISFLIGKIYSKSIHLGQEARRRNLRKSQISLERGKGREVCPESYQEKSTQEKKRSCSR